MTEYAIGSCVGQKDTREVHRVDCITTGTAGTAAVVTAAAAAAVAARAACVACRGMSAQRLGVPPAGRAATVGSCSGTAGAAVIVQGYTPGCYLLGGCTPTAISNRMLHKTSPVWGFNKRLIERC